MLRFEPESSCLGCTIFVTILWFFSEKKEREGKEQFTSNYTSKQNGYSLFKKSVCCWCQQRPDPPPKKKKDPTPLGATQIDKGLSTKAWPCFLWRRLPRCVVKPPGWQLTAVCIPVPHVTATLGILSLVLFTLPLFNFFFLFWLIIHLHFSWRCVEETKGD